jgi:hypothetical protein
MQHSAIQSISILSPMGSSSDKHSYFALGAIAKTFKYTVMVRSSMMTLLRVVFLIAVFATPGEACECSCHPSTTSFAGPKFGQYPNTTHHCAGNNNGPDYLCCEDACDCSCRNDHKPFKGQKQGITSGGRWYCLSDTVNDEACCPSMQTTADCKCDAGFEPYLDAFGFKFPDVNMFCSSDTVNDQR